MTDTQTDTETTRARFDHDAIRADLDSGASIRVTADKHGCSPSLVQYIRRGMGEAGDRTPRNAQRAIALRKKAEQMEADVALLTKWQANEVEGSGETPVSDILALVEEAREQLTTAAALYDALPEQLTRKAKRAKLQLETGMMVRIRDEFRETYAAITTTPDSLEVIGMREGDSHHVLVRDGAGSRLFLLTKELELRQDD